MKAEDLKKKLEENQMDVILTAAQLGVTKQAIYQQIQKRWRIKKTLVNK